MELRDELERLRRTDKVKNASEKEKERARNNILKLLKQIRKEK